MAVGTPVASSIFDGLIGPIIPGFFVVDELSLAILFGLAALTALLILCMPATDDFARHVIMLLFFCFGAIALVTARHVVAFYGAWEITTLFAWGITRLAGESEATETRIVPFQAAGALGSFAMLVGLALLASSRRTLDLSPLTTDTTTVGLGPIAALLLIAIVLKAFGLLSDSWNLRSERQHFSLAGAILAGAGLLVIGAYPFFRLFGVVLNDSIGWRGPVFWAASALSLLTALGALGESDYRRALSYSAFSQFALIAAIFSNGSPAAITAAIVGSIGNAFAFTGIFLAAGAAEAATARVTLDRIGGLAQRLPLTAALFVGCAAAIVGLIPLEGGMTNRVVGLAAAPAPILAAVWLAVVGLTLVSFARLFVALFLGEVRGPVEAEHRWPTIVASGGILATFFLLEATANDLYALVRPLASLLPG